MTTEELRALFVRAGRGSLFDDAADRVAADIRKDIERVEAEYARRYGSKPNLMVRLCEQGDELMAFVQALAAPMSTSVRVLVLQMIAGASLVALDYRYREREESHLEIRIRMPDGKEDRFVSEDLWDTEVIRHLGTMKVGERPVLDGYFAYVVPH